MARPLGFDVANVAEACRAHSGHPLPTLDCCVHIEQIDLDAVSTPAGALGGKKGRTAAAIRIQNDVIALR